jgi:hypothetical protein
VGQPETLSAPPTPRRRAARVPVHHRLVRLVAGVPANLRTKLLVGFLAIAALLVVVSVIGLQVLGKTNGRVVGLGTLQLRSSTYQALEAHATDLRQALGARSAERSRSRRTPGESACKADDSGLSRISRSPTCSRRSSSAQTR